MNVGLPPLLKQNDLDSPPVPLTKTLPDGSAIFHCISLGKSPPLHIAVAEMRHADTVSPMERFQMVAKSRSIVLRMMLICGIDGENVDMKSVMYDEIRLRSGMLH